MLTRLWAYGEHFPLSCMSGDKTPFCPFILFPSLLCGSLMIARVLGIYANNEFSRATFPFFLLFFPLEWLTLKRIIYQIIFIQLWRKKKEEKGGEKPFCGFNCFAASGGDSAQLIKAHTADALRSWLSTASLERLGSADGLDSASANLMASVLRKLIQVMNWKFWESGRKRIGGYFSEFLN